MFDLAVRDIDGELRMRDLDIAEALGFERPRDFRKLLDRNRTALAEFGEIICATVAHINERGRDPKESWLNEYQAFYICTQSKAPRALEVTHQVINVFVAWRNGRLSAPDLASNIPGLSSDVEVYLSLVREVRLTKGKAAASWLYDRLPLPKTPSAGGDVGGSEDDERCAIALFLSEECIVSGNPKHWTRTRDLYHACLAFCVEGGIEPPGKRSFCTRLRFLSAHYRCPDNGVGFRPAKRSDTGYCGIHLIARRA